MAEETKEPTVKVQFRKGQTTPEAHVTHAAYSRVFKRSEQPFELKTSDWEQHVARTGLFEIAPEKKDQQQGGQEQQGGQQGGGGAQK